MEAQFWSINVEPGYKYKRVLANCIELKKAVLDLKHAKSTDDLVQLRLQLNNNDMPLANFSISKGVFQVPLNILFDKGAEMEFSILGSQIPVSIYGECMANDCSDDDDEDDDEECDFDSSLVDSEEIEGLGDSLTKKRKNNPIAGKPSKKAKLYAKLVSSETLSEDSDDEFYNPVDDSTLGTNDNLPEDDTLNDSDIEDEESSEEVGEEEEEEEDDGEFEDMETEEEQAGLTLHSVEFSEDDSDEEITVKSPPKRVALNKEVKSTNGTKADSPKTKKGIKTTDGTSKDSPKAKKQKEVKITNGTPQADSPKTKKSNGQADDVVGTPLLTKKQRKEERLAKAQQESAKKLKKESETVVATPSDQKKKNKDKEAQSPATKVSITPKQPKETRVDTPKPRVDTPKPTKHVQLKGGVRILDLMEGAGAPVAKGHKVKMYYRGTLKDGKMFDQCVKGPPFSFKLGAGNVIDAWDVGVVGMKTGGKRKISCPPNMAYGTEGSLPEIPPNAHLDFEVTLMSFK